MPEPRDLTFIFDVPESQLAYLQESATFILRHMGAMYDLIVAVGQRLLDVRATVAEGTFMQWIASFFPHSYDTALNYMHVAENMANVPSNAAVNINAGALYLLSDPGVSEDARQQAISYAGSQVVNYDLAYVLCHAPGYLKALVTDGKVAIGDAAAVAKGLKSAKPEIQEAAQVWHVQSSDVLHFLKEVYNRYGSNECGDFNLWQDLLNTGGVLIYNTETVPLAQASKHACQSYLDFHHYQRLQEENPRELVYEGAAMLLPGRSEYGRETRHYANLEVKWPTPVNERDKEQLYIQVWRLL